MRKWKDYEIVILVMVSIAVNFGGKLLAESLQLPFWLDSIGTVAIACALGPICGMMVGACNNIMFGAMYPQAIIYCIVNAMVGALVGVCAQYGLFKKSFHVFSVGMLVAFLSAIVSYPLNYTIYRGLTGNLWGDGVIHYLSEHGVNNAISYFFGELYLDIVDKLLSVFVVYFAIKFWKGRSKRNTQQIAGCLLLGVVFSAVIGLAMPNSVLAKDDNQDDNPEKKFGSFIQMIYDETNGIPGGRVNDIEQTRDGIIWIGTYGGLYQYDGSKFTHMSQLEPARQVNCLYTDEEGRLWIGTNDDGVIICANNEIVNILDDKSGLPANSVRSVVKSSDGVYYIGTVDSLVVVELSDGIRIVNVIESLKYVTALSANSKGYVCAVTASGNLALLKDKEVIRIYENAMDGSGFATAAFDSNDSLYAATTQQTVERYAVRNNSLYAMNSYPIERLNHINAIFRSKDGLVFLCADNGIGYLDRDGSYTDLHTNGFDSSVENMMVDYQGNYWFSSSRLGLLKLCESDFEEIFNKLALPEKVVNAIVKWNDKFFFGTDAGLCVADAQLNSAISLEWAPMFDAVRIRNLMVDRNKHLWISASGSGVYDFSNNGEYVHYSVDNGLVSNRTRQVLQKKDGTYVVATDSGISFIRHGEVTGSITEKDGLPIARTLCLLEYAGNLYAGTDGGGIAVIKDDQVIRVIRRADGLRSDVILRMVPASDGTGILVVTGNGLAFLHQNGAVRQLSAFPYYNNYDIIPMGDGNVWITCSAGVYVVSEQQLLENNNLDYKLLDRKRGLGESFTANSWNYVCEDKIFLCGDSGAVSVDAVQAENLNVSYRIALETMSIDGRAISVDKEEMNWIERDAARIEFFPKVINYSVNDPYVGIWLEGFDEGPIVTLQSEMESVIYTNLPSGDYTFHLAIMDNQQKNILEEVVYTFRKDKAIYDNWWFLLYLFSIMTIIVVYLVWLIVGSQINKSLQLQREQIENMRLKQTADAALAAGEAKDRFLALMSHEIRTPINAILGMNEMILRDCKESSIADYALDIKNAGNTLLSLVNGILDFSKIEQGKMEIIPVEYETFTFINTLVNSIAERMKKNNLEFRVHIDKNLPRELYGDDVRIGQVISNLLTNAVKYTEKGSVDLTIREEARKNDLITLYVEVKDTGIGIRKEDMDKLFESFQRLEEKRNRTIEGTGLGMSIVSNLLGLMGSKLQVESEYGIGSTFSFVIDQKIIVEEPIGEYSVEHARLHDKPIEHHIQAPNAKVLIVDDNEMNLKVASGLMRINQIVPDTLTSGKAALERLRTAQYDLIFMDHMMPEMDGIETLHHIREEHLVPESTKIVILTANAINGVKELYLNEGFDDYLSKPIKVDSLERMLVKYLSDEQQEATGENAAKDTGITASGNGDFDADSADKARLKEICGEIDIELGMSYCMDSWEFYNEILVEYCSGNKIEKLMQLYEQKDWENYRILIHSVKSTSMSIGAVELSDEAKALEFALRDGNETFVEKKHPEFMPKYIDFISRLQTYLPKEE